MHCPAGRKSINGDHRTTELLQKVTKSHLSQNYIQTKIDFSASTCIRHFLGVGMTPDDPSMQMKTTFKGKHQPMGSMLPGRLCMTKANGIYAPMVPKVPGMVGVCSISSLRWLSPDRSHLGKHVQI